MISDDNAQQQHQESNDDSNEADEENSDDAQRCIICFESVAIQNMYTTRCQHTWCKQCHQKLKQFDKHKYCIVCRQPLKKKRSKKKQRHKTSMPFIYNDIHDEVEYESTQAFGFTRPWRIKRRLRREMRSLLAQIKLRR